MTVLTHTADPLSTPGDQSDTATLPTPIQRLWAELTGNCQLACVHCYADSGPDVKHGRMTAEQWIRVVDEAKTLGVSLIQCIGGEPTMHPQFPAILRHILDAGLDVEVYSNLVHITDEVWELLRSTPRASLAFSYYSADAGQHNAVTGRNSHAATRRNVIRAVDYGITIRAGVIDAGTGQVPSALADLRELGVTRMTTDRIRAIGRGGDNDPAELCGHCGTGAAAIGPDGDVWPCVFSRWVTVGNVLTSSLSEILTGSAMADAIATLPQQRTGACDPNTECTPGHPPTECNPRN